MRKIYDNKLREKDKIKKNTNVLNNFIINPNNQSLIENRRPFSNGELFALFLLIFIIAISLVSSILFAYFTGKELDTIPTWLIK